MKSTPRDKAFFEIINALNDVNRQERGGLFNCGELGHCLVYWQRGWKCTWYEAETLQEIRKGTM